jgi:hypothetical protein
VNFSAHPALIDQQQVLCQIANARRDSGCGVQYGLTSNMPSADERVTSCISLWPI